MKRQNGWYFVRIDDEWRPAEWYDGDWDLSPMMAALILEVDERPISIAMHDENKSLRERVERLEGYLEAASRVGIDDQIDNYAKAVAAVKGGMAPSITAVQRLLKLSYASAGRIIDGMEEDGIISKANSAGSRRVLSPPVECQAPCHADDDLCKWKKWIYPSEQNK